MKPFPRFAKNQVGLQRGRFDKNHLSMVCDRFVKNLFVQSGRLQCSSPCVFECSLPKGTSNSRQGLPKTFFFLYRSLLKNKTLAIVVFGGQKKVGWSDMGWDMWYT